MDKQSVRERVIARLVEASDEELESATVTESTDLRKDLDLTSLQAVMLMMDLEDDFGIEVDDEEIDGLGTVGDVLDLIERKSAEAPG